jgi:hypothetical protein
MVSPDIMPINEEKPFYALQHSRRLVKERMW